MTKIQFSPIDVKGLSIESNICNLRRDLAQFVSYISERSVKRTHRENRLSRLDANRLAKMMSDPLAAVDIKEEGSSSWIDFVDETARHLGFIHYDTKGEYMGYSSAEPSFPDNYIELGDEAYRAFLAKPLQEQEQAIFDTIIETSGNEFFSTTPFSLLDNFNSWGSATGVLPTLDFPAVRRFLFNLLKDCQSDVWYSTDSLTQYLKSHHPYFLIPEKPKYARGYQQEKRRYGNFKEQRGNGYGERFDILETDADCFERVEGRYIERFLERIPLSLGYIDVAYGTKKDPDLFPSYGQLKAFRLKPAFLHFLNRQISQPTVIVKPDFEIQIDSALYPFQVMSELSPFTDLVAEDVAIILKLQKKKVARQLAENDALDVVGLLKRWSVKELPQNVVTELEEWEGHSEAFILYKGFAVLEGNAGQKTEKYHYESISPELQIVTAAQELFSDLEKAELTPLKIRHQINKIRPLPRTVKTVFPQEASQLKTPFKRRKSVLKREVSVTLHFPSKELLEIFQQDLLKAHCPVEVNQSKKTIVFEKNHENHIKDTIRRIKKEHQIQIIDID